MSPHNFPLVKSLGATHAIDRSLPASDLNVQILSILNSIKPSIVFDAVSEAETQKVAWEFVAPGGLLNIVFYPEIDASKEEGEKKRHLYQVVGSVHLPHLRDVGYVMYAELPKLLAEGKLKVR